MTLANPGRVCDSFPFSVHLAGLMEIDADDDWQRDSSDAVRSRVAVEIPLLHAQLRRNMENNRSPFFTSGNFCFWTVFRFMQDSVLLCVKSSSACLFKLVFCYFSTLLFHYFVVLLFHCFTISLFDYSTCCYIVLPLIRYIISHSENQ